MSDSGSKNAIDADQTQIPTPLPSQPSPRDLRLDLIRGAALLCMHTDHFRHNELSAWTPRNFGFSDMAEVFVFVSGCVCGIAYGKVLRSQGWLRCQLKALARVCQLVGAGAITLLALVSVQVVSKWDEEGMTRGTHFWSPLSVVVGMPVSSLRDIEGGSQVVGILSLYGMLLVALPMMLWLRERHWSLLAGTSVVLYGVMQVGWMPALHGNGWDKITPFHPLTWQLMFTLGILSHKLIESGRLQTWGRGSLAIVSLVVIDVACVSRLWWPVDEIPLIDKSTLGPLRVLHLLAVMVLAYTVIPGRTQGLWNSAPMRWLILCGQNSLFVFCVGSVLVVGVEGLLIANRHSLASQCFANLVVWGGCVLLAFAWRYVQGVLSLWMGRAAKESPAPVAG